MQQLLSDWKNFKKEQIRKRGMKGLYPHFDKIYDIDDPHLERFLMHPEMNNFYPFIRNDIIQRRYRRGQKNAISRKNRPIMYPAHKDALIYSFYSYKLYRHYEKILDSNDLSDNVTAYRSIKNLEGKGKCNIDFAKEVFDIIKERKDCSALVFDIKGFFDNLDHSLLKANWTLILGLPKLPQEDYSVFKSITNFSYVFLGDIKKTLLNQKEIKMGHENSKKAREEFRKILNKKRLPSLIYPNPQDFKNKIRPLIKSNRSNSGIPQGSPISGILANIYMLNFDKNIKKQLHIHDVYRRYSDDLIILCETARTNEVKKMVLDEIAKSRLTIQAEKIDLVVFQNAEISNSRPYLKYLGFEFDGKNVFLRSGTSAKRVRKNIHKIKAQLAIKSKLNSTKKRKIIRKKLGRFNYYDRAFRLMESNGIKKQNSKFNNLLGRLRKKLQKK